MQNFINKIEKIYPLSEDERGFLSGKIKYLKIPAKHLLIKKGDIAKNVYYIEKGFMDTYCYDSKGHKRVFNFHFDNEIITNHASFLNETPSTFNLESLEETELYYINFDDRNDLFEQYPNFINVARLYYEYTLTHFMLQVQNKFIASPEEKYLYLMDNHPEIFQKVSLTTIADYMNIQPQSLSRIRKRLTR